MTKKKQDPAPVAPEMDAKPVVDQSAAEVGREGMNIVQEQAPLVVDTRGSEFEDSHGDEDLIIAPNPDAPEATSDVPPDAETLELPEPTIEEQEKDARAELEDLLYSLADALEDIDIEGFRRVYEPGLATWQELAQKVHEREHGTRLREQPVLPVKIEHPPVSGPTMAWLVALLGTHTTVVR